MFSADNVINNEKKVNINNEKITDVKKIFFIITTCCVMFAFVFTIAFFVGRSDSDYNRSLNEEIERLEAELKNTKENKRGNATCRNDNVRNRFFITLLVKSNLVEAIFMILTHRDEDKKEYGFYNNNITIELIEKNLDALRETARKDNNFLENLKKYSSLFTTKDKKRRNEKIRKLATNLSDFLKTLKRLKKAVKLLWLIENMNAMIKLSGLIKELMNDIVDNNVGDKTFVQGAKKRINEYNNYVKRLKEIKPNNNAFGFRVISDLIHNQEINCN